MSKVYIANYSPTNSYREVESIGTPVFVTEGIVKAHPSRLHEIFRQAFELAGPEDYLLLTGSQIVIAVAYAEWTKKFSEASIFVWDKRANRYLLHQVSIT